MGIKDTQSRDTVFSQNWTQVSNFNFQVKQPDELKSDKQINLGSDLKSMNSL